MICRARATTSWGAAWTRVTTSCSRSPDEALMDTRALAASARKSASATVAAKALR